MFWTEEKLDARIRELGSYRYRDARPIASFRVKEDPAGRVGEYPCEEGAWRELKIGEEWSGLDAYLWLAADPAVPGEWNGRRIVGRFDFGTTGGGGNSGFESLLFVDGVPYQGVDSNHTEVFLPQHTAGRTASLRFRLWSGLTGYDKPAPLLHRLLHASLSWLDEGTDDLFFTARAALDTVRRLGEGAIDRHRLLAALDRAFRCVDWSEPGSEAFYGTTAEAGASLSRELERMPKQDGVTVTCVGHTHIDVAWLWRLRHTREKAARSFSTVLRLMEDYPEYLFLQTQPQLYAYLKSDYPDIYDRIRERVKEGKWEAGGAMWLEADCNLPSGESLIRQLLYGRRFLRDEFGVECDYLWLPDVFGYSWALPQILRKSGIKVFMTTKISWNQYNRMPHDTFSWRGIDGSEILTHFITTPDPGTHEGQFYYTYNGVVTAETVTGIWEGYRNKGLNDNLLLAYGYGDGGGGVNREMLEMRRRLDRMPGLPRVVTGRADDYFAELRSTVENTDQYVHTWDGELYLELHRGTYTSQAHVKRSNRKMELLLRECEWLHCLGAAAAGDWSAYPAERLREAWTIVLRNQFHDIIPGSSIREVYEDCREEYSEARRLGRQAWDEAASGIAGGRFAGRRNQERDRHVRDDRHDGYGGHNRDGGYEDHKRHDEYEGNEEIGASVGSIFYTVFNGASWDRTEPVLIPIDEAVQAGRGGTWHSERGERLGAQRCGDGWLVQIETPSMGYAVLEFRPGLMDAAAEAAAAVPGDKAPTVCPFSWNDYVLQTPHYEMTFNDCGQLIRLYDKLARREVLAAGKVGNVLQVFEDKPKSRHEAWDIDIFYTEKMMAVTDLLDMQLEEMGPLRAVISFVWRYGNSVIRQKMIVYAGSRRIDYDTHIDWRERRQLLKAAFPVNVRSTEATYDIQFGNVKRPTHWNTSWDYARFETVGHQWADLSERRYGVSLLNDCKYGYDVKDNVLRLSLIKSAMVPDDTADQGEHNFTYSLLPHEGDWFAGRTVQEAWALNSPLTCAPGASACGSFSMFTLSADHVVIDTVKKAEDGEAVIVRLHEFSGAGGQAVLRSGKTIVSWTECDLMENELTAEAPGPEAAFAIAPYEIKTFMVRLA